MAEAEMKSIASIRLQEKYNCVANDFRVHSGVYTPFPGKKRPRLEPIPDDEDAMEE